MANSIIMTTLRLRRAYTVEASQLEALSVRDLYHKPDPRDPESNAGDVRQLGAHQLINYLNDEDGIRYYDVMGHFLLHERFQGKVPALLVHWNAECPPRTEEQWQQAVDEVVRRFFGEPVRAQIWAIGWLKDFEAQDLDRRRRQTVTMTQQVTASTAGWTGVIGQLQRQLHHQLAVYELLQTREAGAAPDDESAGTNR